jgi:triacylglycerol lipase
VLRVFFVTCVLVSLAFAACSGGSGAPDPTATPEGPSPALLVHGWAGHAAQMEDMRAQLEQAGIPAFTIELPGNDNVVNAQAIADKVIDIEASTGAAKVDLVGYSMGGLSTRYYIKRLAGLSTTGKYVSFGTPHYGGDIACVLDEPNGGQMCPGSAFLVDLNEGDDTPGDIPYTTIWSDQEVPDSAGKLDGGACFVNIPGVGHADEPASSAIIDAVLQALRGTCQGEQRSDAIE